MKSNFIFYGVQLFFFLSPLFSESLSLPLNLLKNKNFNLNGIKGYEGIEYHQYIKQESHIKDGSGSIKLLGHWYTKQFRTPSFKLKKGKQYLLGVYMKALESKYGQNVMFKIGGVGETSEMNWNVSKVNSWEEILMPYRAKKTGLYYLSLFTYSYALSKNNKSVNQKGDNLDRTATLYFDDFFVYESEKLLSHERKTLKNSFYSDSIRIDSHGNWSVYSKGVWKAIFPKFSFQDWENDDFKIYKEYGFTGIINIDTLKKLHNALKMGLKYNGIQVNQFDSKIKQLRREFEKEIAKKKLPASSILLYCFDNEGKYLSNTKQTISKLLWLKEQDKKRPIYMLNGVAEGLTRQYNNIIDVTGTYISATGNEIEKYENPINSLELLNRIHNQKVPVSIMQLQCYYHKLFVPSIFKGLGEGAKALSFWRGGKHVERYGCPKDFRKNVWASSIKGKNGIFALIDTLLPIIREPLETKWSVSIDIPSLVSVASRNHDSKHYLFLANFSNKAQYVNVVLEDLNVSSVQNFFTKKYLYFGKKRDCFSVYIDKYNDGYLVLEIN